jgi:DNA mismatch repair protein MutS2
MDIPSFHLAARAARDLGFDDVRAVLAALCASPFGREALDDDVFPTTMEALESRFAGAMEAKELVLRKVSPDFGGMRDVRAILIAIEKGTVLAAADILDVAKTLDAIARLHDVISFQREEAPILAESAAQLSDDRRFVRRVLRSFDEAGQLTDDASPELAIARARVRALRAEAQEKLEGMVRDLDDEGTLRDRNFTVRNDRYVLPVKSEYQGRVEGIVHDASQTHQTVFIEPRALLQLGNRIKIARADVINEEQRILGEMTLEVAELADDLVSDLFRAGVLEAAFARGIFAARTDGTQPKLSPEAQGMTLVAARHPLLLWMRAEALARGESAPAVVANNIGFGGARAIVITGPNAGGKTVALKTSGLIAVLARAGIPVSVDEKSVVPLYACVACTIGDEQSLDRSLSSFSGHLVALRAVLDDVNAQLRRGPVLCLLDELLSGTDPAQGASLAQALLEDLVERGAFVIATTHYERLKALGLVDDEKRRFRNASVALEHGTGRPTFVLHLDQVGTSNAMEAALRYGLPDGIVARAQELLAPDEKQLFGLLSTLAARTAQLEQQIEKAEADRKRVHEESLLLERKLAEVEREGARLRREGKRAFLDEIHEARKILATAIESTKGPLDARTLNKVSQDLHDTERRMRADVEAPAARKSELLRPLHLKLGDVVELAHMPGSRMSVLELDGDEAVVGKGTLRMRVGLDVLRAPGEAEPEAKRARKADRKSERESVTSSAPGVEPRTTDNTLDVRGHRAEEAVELLDAFLDRLLRQGRNRAFVLHGHGTGSLKKAVRAALANSKYVSRSSAADHEDGGDGLTVITLDDHARL